MPVHAQRAANIALRDGDRALFASDVHLDDRERATADAFFGALEERLGDATHLFLLGDLFEAWVGDDDPSAVGERLVQALARACASGKHVYLMRGNRDVLLDAPLPAHAQVPSFSERCGATMLEDPSVVSMFGAEALLAHGDAYCIDDHDYQAFRAASRSERVQTDFLAKPLERRIELVRAIREHSRAATGAKPDELMDVNRDAVSRAMHEAGVALLIHGHTHRPARHAWTEHGVAMERWVLPDWDVGRGRGGMLVAGPEGLRQVGRWV